MSIRARLMVLILFATLIPALVGVMIFLEHRESEIAGARQNLAAATRQVAQDLTNTIRSTAQLHYGLSRARDFDTQDRAACSAFLANVLKEHPQYTGILTIKPDGELFCDSLRTGPWHDTHCPCTPCHGAKSPGRAAWQGEMRAVRGT